MLWLTVSLALCWLVYREFRLRRVARPGYDDPIRAPVSKLYVLTLLVLAMLFAWPPFKTWRIERLLDSKGILLTEGQAVHVHCNTVFDTLFDPFTQYAGHAHWDTGRIFLQHPWCTRLHDYLADPDHASREERLALLLFTHETMHIRGEHDEARTECQAVQRTLRAARLLGVPEAVARRDALRLYTDDYMARAEHGDFSRAYWSPECAPGRAMDEHLADSSWPSIQATSSTPP